MITANSLNTLAQEMIDTSRQENIRGKDTDLMIQTIAGNFKNIPFWNIELKSFEKFLLMLNDCDKYFIYPTAGKSFETKMGDLVALYYPSDISPLARCYSLPFNMHNGTEYLTKLSSMAYTFTAIDDNSFGISIQIDTLPDREEKYLKRRDKNTSGFQKLFDGRQKNTSTSTGIAIITEKCTLCGEPITNFLSTTLSTDDNGMIVFYNVCEECMKKAYDDKSKTNIDFLLKKFKQDDPLIPSVRITDEELLTLSESFIKNKLDCEIEKVIIEKMEIHAIRNSNFKIIFRLQKSNADKLSYAYMIFDHKGNQLRRIDSANDHKDRIDIGPDHIHTNLKKSNKVVESSYTTGYLITDLPLIKELLAKLEKENMSI